jgi:hypothetical protein
MLAWGIYAALWTFPNDQGSILNGVLDGEHSSTYCCGNGTIIRPESEAQFIMIFQTNPTNPGSCGSCLLPNGQGWVTGPFALTAPKLAFSSFQKYYAVFTFAFTAFTPLQQIAQRFAPPWFSGPQGNMSESISTSIYAGLRNLVTPFFETAILEISIPGNYTLHYFNAGSVNATGRVAMGPSSVVYSRPYFYPGLATIATAGIFSIINRFDLRTRIKRRVASLTGMRVHVQPETDGKMSTVIAKKKADSNGRTLFLSSKSN